MKLSRRELIRATCGAVAATALAPGIARAEVRSLRATRARQNITLPEYPATEIWGYDGSTPGPVIRTEQGGRIRRRFLNDLPQASTVHWHGVRIDNAMDGVPQLTQTAVPPGGEFLYDFVAPDAGTYWYHPHNLSWEQMARGLYGAIVVEEREPPQTDRDEVLLIDDWRLTEGAKIDESFGAMHDWAHGGRLGNWITVNGRGEFGFPVQRHQRLRLRLVNTANARIFELGLRGLAGWIVALDGQPLETPEPLSTLVLAPAQRADLIVDVVAKRGEQALIASLEQGTGYVIASFDVDGDLRGKRLAMPEPLAQNALPLFGGIGKARPVTLTMEGGAMGRMRSAELGGRQRGMRELVQAGKVWAFNGLAELPDRPWVSASPGETLRVRIVNDTGWPHAMHLHGHHFRTIGASGAVGPLRDTVLVEADDSIEIAFVADNPGDWLFHCHMLEHTAGGMATWLRVS